MTPARLAELMAFYADEPRHDGEPGTGPARVVAERHTLGLDASRWERGQQGEVEVAESLAELRSAGWTMLHALPRVTVTSGIDPRITVRDIDHLLIGPGGVFAVNTKNMGTKLYLEAPNRVVDDYGKTTYADEVLAEAAYVSRRLSINWPRRVPVEAVIIAAQDRIQIAPNDETLNRVGLLQKSVAAKGFLSLPRVLDELEVAGLAFWASLSGVWRGRRYLGALAEERIRHMDQSELRLLDRVTSILRKAPGTTFRELYKALPGIARCDLEDLLATAADFIEEPRESSRWRLADRQLGRWSL